MLFHNTIRKYTLAMLDTFNDLKIEHKLSNGTYSTATVPLKYSSQEKSRIFDEHDTKQLLEGNTSILPRANLALSTIVKSTDRVTNKFSKINTKDNEFTFNGVPYLFTYDLTIQCRGMNEASMIYEQIATKFNPVYTIKINEVPNQTEPTSINIALLEIGIVPEEYDDISTNIVTLSVGLELKGTFYPPIRTLERIENVDTFVNMWHQDSDNTYNRATRYNYDMDTGINTKYDLTVDGQFTKILPTITDISSEDSVLSGENLTLEVIYTDPDNKFDELIFVWNVTGSASITSGSNIVQLTGTTEVVDVSCLITDIHGNSSETFIKQIIIV